MSESEDVAATADTQVTAQRAAEVEGPATAATPLVTAAHAPGWIRRRARNVYRRPLLVSAVGLTVFVAVLVAAVLAPLQERRAVRAALPPARMRPDTVAILRHIGMAGSVIRTTDSALLVARQTNRQASTASDTAVRTDFKRTALLAESARLDPAPTPVPVVETMSLERTRDSAIAALASAHRWLLRARDVERDMDASEARAKSADAIGASVPAMLAGAGALGLVVGFAVGLALEVRDPRVSDEDEAESIAGVRVLASIGEAPAAPVRRRLADQEMPPLVELYSEAYRLLFAQLADRADNLPLLSIVGDDALTTAVVSANLGAVAARQVRDVLVIDTDVERQSLSSVTRVRGTPGLVDVLAGRVEWAAAVRSVVVDRDRTLDVMPSGAFGAHEALDSMTADVTQLLEHVRRRYDCVLLSAPMSGAGALSLTATLGSPVLVVRRARTPVRSLSGLTGLIRDRGCRTRGVLMWNRGEPIAVSA
ncbi:MAG TPA: hypothetical protein VF118_09875 [Gemmatimonadaceae bacterium]